MMPNAVWTAALTVVLAALTYLAWKSNRPRFLVAFIHNGVWAGALVLIGTNLIAYKEASTLAWLTLLCALICFNLGIWIARWPLRQWWRLGRPARPPRAVNTAPLQTEALLNRKLLLVLVLLYALGFGAYLVNIELRFGLLELITDPSGVRGYHGESYLESVPLPFRLLLYIGPLLFVIFGYKASLERPFGLTVRISAMVLLTLSMLALLQRTNLFMAILWLIAALITQPRSHTSSSPIRGHSSSPLGTARFRRGWKIVFASVAFVAVALAAFQIVGGALHKNGQQALSTTAVSAPLRDSGLTSPFVYYTAGTVAFLQLADSPNHHWPPQRIQGAAPVVGNYNPQTWGASTFAPIAKIVPGLTPWNSIAPFIDTAVWTNVYTWIEPYYRDFRLPGVAVAMFLLGMVIGRLYSRRRESARMFWLQASFLSTVFLATFVTKINNTLFLCELLFVFLLTIGYRHGRRPPAKSHPTAVSDLRTPVTDQNGQGR